ncbi:acVLRF1 family peptidyl-tRNA hydrolase [Sphaerisporangium fuscum]|uniref:acVLRF1 family peptidyl-tRNA hydrolase n=1 Tax=Sphaerisporangium fuscum TaxID=2835868 RepID=UPI001BDC1522|nr:acVLRF1 family peptidyl-tRNA hydrolase [Sphaerisporangium fuscum]
MAGRPAAGGGRWVAVGPERLEGWLGRFVERHGAAKIDTSGDVVRVRATDGAVAELHVPFPPLPEVPSPPPETGEPAAGAVVLRALVAHADTERRIGVLLVRLGGYAAGVFEGERLITSKVGSRLVHGRSAAGGWSQQRFARRREKQAGEASRAAAEVAVRVLVPQVDALDAVVLGGDRRAVDALRADRRLEAVFALETPPFLDVPDPRLAVLQETPKTFRAVRIRLLDPAP